jgi:hypothetical protein
MALRAICRKIGPCPGLKRLALVKWVGHSREIIGRIGEAAVEQFNVIERPQLIIRHARIRIMKVKIQLGGRQPERAVGLGGMALVTLLTAGIIPGV